MGSPPDKGFGQGDPALARWAEKTFVPEDAVLAEIRARAAREGLPPIAVGPMDGLHLEVLARAAAAKRAVEIGTLGGYSGVCLARGLGPDGLLHTFEVEPEHARVARESFERAGVAGRVRIHVGPAEAALESVEADGPFDLVFIDADKAGYPSYLAWAEEHLRVGGIVLADNAFAFGQIHDPSGPLAGESGVRPLRAFARRLASGGRFRSTLLPTGEGLALGVKVR
ncbi:MAG TPA: O-methyltransferase [Anaeromyxobacteraceae bacterium]|nr:O-methyltransferase [Anaeromyxobacteraceae bacterium]